MPYYPPPIPATLVDASELAAALADVSTSLAGKQSSATAATDAELAAAVSTLQAAATAATDAELSAAVSTLTTALATKQDSSTAATDAELAASRSTKVTKSNVALGTQGTGESAYTYYEITSVCQRGLMSQFTVTDDGAGTYDVDLRSASAGGGIQLLAAVDANGTYEITVPVYIEGDGNSSIWLGIKNKGGTARTFTLSALRVEKFA